MKLAYLNFGVLSFVASTCWATEFYGQSLDGNWESEGYGYYFSIVGTELEAYEVTAISCIFGFGGIRQAESATDGNVTFKMIDEPVTFTIGTTREGDEGRLHFDGTASDIVIHRLSSPPSSCDKPSANTPQSNFDIFVQTWAELYGFFDLKNANWPAIVKFHRLQVSDGTTPKELFRILTNMIEPFEDAHTYIRAESIGERWSTARRTSTWLDRADRLGAFQISEDRYLRTPLRSWCNGQIEFGMLVDAVAYLRLRSFEGFGEGPGFESGLIALEFALDEIFANASAWSGLAIDVRINGGGYDPYGLAIASRLATREYLAYSKQASADPENPTKWTGSQPSWVLPSSRPGFRGEVVELIGIHSVSAAETFTQALFGRDPNVIRVGENTQGVFSDVQRRQLPNGWLFGLPNERFVTDGKSYDGLGIPPNIEILVFPIADLENSRDGAIEKALDYLRRNSSAGKDRY